MRREKCDEGGLMVKASVKVCAGVFECGSIRCVSIVACLLKIVESTGFCPVYSLCAAAL